MAKKIASRLTSAFCCWKQGRQKALPARLIVGRRERERRDNVIRRKEIPYDMGYRVWGC
jgi:hypothetical protein